MKNQDENSPCPCASGKSYQACCYLYHSEVSLAPTAETLMRSRYSAFAKHQIDYLLKTHLGHEHDQQLKRELEDQRLNWIKLEIVHCVKGLAKHSKGEVHFIAQALDPKGNIIEIKEKSQFVKKNGRWYYRSGVSW